MDFQALSSFKIREKCKFCFLASKDSFFLPVQFEEIALHFSSVLFSLIWVCAVTDTHLHKYSFDDYFTLDVCLFMGLFL